MILRWSHRFLGVAVCAYTLLFIISSSVAVQGSGSGSETCVACPAGKFANGSLDNCSCVDRCNCTNLPNCDCLGFCDAVDDCTPCPVGQVAPHNTSTTCTPCPAGLFANKTGLKECERCKAGFICNTTGCGYCRECPAGTAANFTACNICSPGTYSGTNGSSVCRDCPAGLICNKTGCTKCSACPAGHEAQSIMHCRPCQPGNFRAEGSTNLYCQQCDEGYYQPDDEADHCLQCPEGKFCSDPTRAQDCPTGAHCPAGTYKPIFCRTLFTYVENKKKCVPEAVFYVVLVCVIAASCLMVVCVSVAVYWNIRRRRTVIEEKLPLAKKEPVTNPVYYGH